MSEKHFQQVPAELDNESDSNKSWDDNDSILDYVIHKYSSFSTTFLPSNIYKDEPNNQASRWSSDSSEFPQFLILRLKNPAIVKSITFGKYEKAHVCNIKKFCIYGGLTEENMILLLESGLKNSSSHETFALKCTVGKNKFPIRYIKIMPLQTWGSTFNFSIWYVELKGCGDWKQVVKYINSYSLYREKEAIRMCLKHLRERNYMTAYNSLLKESDIQLEDSFLTEIYEELINNKNYESCEELILKAYKAGYLHQYISEHNYEPKWTQIMVPKDATYKEMPGMRGGHQMVLDTFSQTIYLFGGWDGTQDLNDLWSFDIKSQTWSCISRDTQLEGGPSGRSCHKMCLDPKRRQIFTLGRFVDPAMRNEENTRSDFYLYDIEGNTWTLISEDTASLGGPSLIFDHQLTMDVGKRVIYVLGGRVVIPRDDNGSSTSNRDHRYSGLYSYHVATSDWKLLREDGNSHSSTHIRARIGHSMLLHSNNRQLFILGGQRHKEFLTDFFIYDIESDSIRVISHGARKDPGSMPSPGFTQKSTIDVHQNQIHILAGLSKEKNRKMENVRNSFWIYNIDQNKWTCVYHNDAPNPRSSHKSPPTEPCPRYAYQLVYDDTKKIHYLFGGNPGNSSDPSLRLDDFWSFYLSRPTEENLLHDSIFLLRKTKYKELAYKKPLNALNYLQTCLYESVDHNNERQVKEFHALTTTLFRSPNNSPASSEFSESLNYDDSGLMDTSTTIQSFPDFSPGVSTFQSGTIDGRSSPSPMEDEEYTGYFDCHENSIEKVLHRERLKVFQQISLYMPEDMAQPKSNLIDFIPY